VNTVVLLQSAGRGARSHSTNSRASIAVAPDIPSSLLPSVVGCGAAGLMKTSPVDLTPQCILPDSNRGFWFLSQSWRLQPSGAVVATSSVLPVGRRMQKNKCVNRSGVSSRFTGRRQLTPPGYANRYPDETIPHAFSVSIISSHDFLIDLPHHRCKSSATSFAARSISDNSNQ